MKQGPQTVSKGFLEASHESGALAQSSHLACRSWISTTLKAMTVSDRDQDVIFNHAFLSLEREACRFPRRPLLPVT